MSTLTQSPAWLALQAHQLEISKQQLSSLFEEDAQRFDKFSLNFNNMLLDYSKQPVNEKTIRLLIDLAKQQGLEDWITRMFAGEQINTTEHRAVLHTALRSQQSVWVDGCDVQPDIQKVLQQMASFTQAVRSGEKKGYSGKPFTNVVNIGLGGSDLGPFMVTKALRPYATSGLKPHFVSNVDAAHLFEMLEPLDPATTLFIISSKSFSTEETMLNAQSAKAWFLENGGNKQDIAQHFVAVSTNQSKVEAFGIHPENMFVFWDWVGGRYSLWSAIGLSIALAVGMESFYQLLSGAEEMDRHFATTPLDKNLPVILGLLGIWHINFLGIASHAILPYDQLLNHLPAYLQQLEMESNGKRVNRNGESVNYSTGNIVWGASGINGQHAFYQLLHQGRQTVSADFLVSCQSHYSATHHESLLGGFFAQTEALMHGRSHQDIETELAATGMDDQALEQLLPHKVIPGNRPTTSIIFKKLDPKTLGALIALYEHKVFVQSVIWEINAFDQWGVELGKLLAKTISNELKDDHIVSSHDASTNGLINFFKKHR